MPAARLFDRGDGEAAFTLGFAGGGLIARIHAAGLAAQPFPLRGVVHDPHPTKAAEFASITGADVAATVDELLGRCDVLYVCTWTSEHEALVREAAARGVALFCEKPLATSLDGAERMADAVRDAGIKSQVGLVLRSSPAIHWLRHLVTDPRAGRPMSIGFRDDQYLPVGGYYASEWRADRRRAGAGVLLEHSIHDVDAMELLLGPIASLSCRTRHVHGIDGIEDVAVVSAEFASGALGSLTTVWHDMTERGNERRIEILSEQLWCALDGSHHWGPVHWQFAGGPVESSTGDDLLASATAAGLTTDNQHLRFLTALTEGTAPTPGFDVALRAHRVIDAAYRSAAAGGELIRVPAS